MAYRYGDALNWRVKEVERVEVVAICTFARVMRNIVVGKVFLVVVTVVVRGGVVVVVVVVVVTVGCVTFVVAGIVIVVFIGGCMDKMMDVV